jgi:hypothetical protein
MTDSVSADDRDPAEDLPEPPPLGRGTAISLIALGLVLVGLIAFVVLVGSGDDDSSRQDEVAARGAQVMPFDLETTTHVFDKTGTGGVQTVRAHDDADDEQIPLIRAHLAEEAEAFASGDYDDPMAIHGDEMPGLAVLRADPDAVEVVYAEQPDGATITYTSTDPELVDAIHRWFDAQLADHGDHATTE